MLLLLLLILESEIFKSREKYESLHNIKLDNELIPEEKLEHDDVVTLSKSNTIWCLR